MRANTSKTPRRTYDVTLKFSEGFTYRVEAGSEDEAIEIADTLRMDPLVKPQKYDHYAPESIEVQPVAEVQPD